MLSATLSTVLAERIAALPAGAKPKLLIIQIGDRPESTTYIKNKKIFAEKIGALVDHHQYPENVSERQLLDDLAAYNTDPSVHGIIIQLPIPAHINTAIVIEAIDPNKDVDGLTSKNTKLLLENKTALMPATAKGIITLLDHYGIEIPGKRVVVVGRSLLVGKPMAQAMLNRNATVTTTHSHTKNLDEETRRAEILIVAAGQPKLITAASVSPGQIIVDVGINVIPMTDGTSLSAEGVPKNKIVGDVDFDAVKNTIEAISPVPGGVGPMTIVSLFENLLVAYFLAQNPRI